jgi:hypothetical protein
MRLTKVKLVALAMFVAALGFVGVAAQNAYTDDCFCQAPPGAPADLRCGALGACVDRPWGSIRCLGAHNWEGFERRWCGQ